MVTLQKSFFHLIEFCKLTLQMGSQKAVIIENSFCNSAINSIQSTSYKQLPEREPAIIDALLAIEQALHAFI